MTKKEFVDEIGVMINVTPEAAGTLKEEDRLAEVGSWDSLARIQVIAFFDSNFGLTLTPEQLEQANTVGDLMKLVPQSLS